ncbi:MAG: Bcr/CflA family efflux MFS transporter [Chitinophagaceae bacterium]|nr:MAG: Bcr/CflA family efflux MFS transporter [Chitinophagaceae bacterium]
MYKNNKTIVLIILGMLIAISPFSIDTYLPAFPEIASSLDTDFAHVGYTLSSYYAGLCTGQLIYGILIDRFGRKKPLTVGLSLYFFSALACALTPGINMLIVFRLLMALGGCVGMVVARAMVQDLYPPGDTPKVMSKLVLVMGIAPIIAPTIGSWINQLMGWRWVFGFMALIAIVLIIAVRKGLPETKAADETLRFNISDISFEYKKLLTNKYFLRYAFAGGMAYAGMYAYIAGSPFVFMEIFGFPPSAFGWAFALNAIGLILGSQLNRWALKYFQSEKITLTAMILLSVTALALLITTYFGYALSVLTLTATFLFLFWLGFINPNTTALTLRPFTSSAGRASAMLGSIQMTAGVIASWLVGLLHNGTAVIMPLVMFACTLLPVLLLLKTKNV